MKLFVKILLLIFTMLVIMAVEAKSSTEVTILHKETSYSFIQKSQLGTILFENHNTNSCLNKENVVTYSEWGINVVGSVAKGGGFWRTASEMRDDVVTWATNYRKGLPSNSQLTDFNKACAASYRKTDGTIETVFGRNGGVLNTQKSYPTISAEKGLGLHEELAKRLPKETRWPNIANCAECDAVNQALHNGAKWEDIQIHTINIKDGIMTDVIRCPECQDIFKIMYVTSE